ncbi:pilus assembly protein TadG-related protein [Streptomyces sp. NPDC057445]|uniref:pilus assembly protein TadG-related protein n=1 Tax=Streptomyces sp. NPDC057445 TaxID=3346136 RepID=UPI0036C93D91
MVARKRNDAGQAFPIYVVMVAGLLFLAFAFFAVGQASATRNGAQGAADAAALAAAQDARDQMGPGLLEAILLPGGLADFFDGQKFGTEAACAQAENFASKNRSDVMDLDGSGDGGCSRNPGFLRDEFTVEVKTRYAVKNSLISGSEDGRGTAKATAVVEFRCDLKPVGDPGEDDTEPKEDEKPGPVTFECDGRDLIIDPEDPLPLPQLEKIFAVHLID